MSRIKMKAAHQDNWLEFDFDLGRDGAFSWADGALAVDGRVVTSTGASGEAEGWLDVGGRIVPFAACRVKDRVHVWAAGNTWWIELASTATAKRPAALGGDEIKAPMPGTILKIHAAGDVKAHEVVLVMESMKMELSLEAPRDGRIERVHCKEGDLVEMGTVLVTLETKK